MALQLPAPTSSFSSRAPSFTPSFLSERSSGISTSPGPNTLLHSPVSPASIWNGRLTPGSRRDAVNDLSSKMLSLLIARNFGLAAFSQQTPVLDSANVDMLVGQPLANSTLSMYSNGGTVSSNEDSSWRRRRSWRPRPTSPIIPVSEQGSHTNSFDSSGYWSPSKVVSISKTDLSGGGTIVSRRADDGHVDIRVVYSREFIINAAASPYALLPPANLAQMVLGMNEIMAKFPKRFRPKIMIPLGGGDHPNILGGTVGGGAVAFVATNNEFDHHQSTTEVNISNGNVLRNKSGIPHGSLSPISRPPITVGITGNNQSTTANCSTSSTTESGSGAELVTSQVASGNPSSPSPSRSPPPHHSTSVQ